MHTDKPTIRNNIILYEGVEVNGKDEVTSSILVEGSSDIKASGV